MRHRFQAAVREVETNAASYEAHLSLALGFLMGAEMYGCAAALRRAMMTAGVRVDGLVDSLLEDD
jgi:hypothetical protein